MTVKSKGFLRHVALSVADPWETAEYYKATVGLEEVAELDGPLAEGVFLTDGVVNLAILHFKSDEASQGTGVDFVGIHHIGFWGGGCPSHPANRPVQPVGTWIMGDPSNPDGYEVKHTDLSGIIFDIAAHGWAGRAETARRAGERDSSQPAPSPGAKFDERREAARVKIEANKMAEAAD